MKIANKAFIFTMLLMLIILISSYSALYFWLPSFYRNQKIQDMEVKADILIEELKQTSSKEERQAILNQFTMNYSAQPILASSEEDDYPLPIIVNDAAILKLLPGTDVGNGMYEYSFIIDSSNIHLVKREMNFENHTFTLTIPVTLKPVDEAAHVIAGMLPYLLFFSVAICTVATLFYSKAITKPIVLLSKSTQQMKELEPKAFCKVSSKDEIGELSNNLNSMYQQHLETIQQLNEEMEQVSELEKSQAQFMQAASHELKTPIAALKGIVEGMIDKVGVYKDRDTFLAECNRLLISMENLTNNITAASAKDIDISQTQDINLSTLVEHIISACLPLSQQKGVTILSEIVEDVLITSSITPLEQIISNIMTNAILYASHPYEVRVSLTCQQKINLAVFNSCLPLSDDELRHVFDPFYRLERSKAEEISGSGLGLNIVSQLSASLQLKYCFTSSLDGMNFTVIFP